MAGRSAVYARRGMVCASQPLAAGAGLDVLKRGGSAVDAAIATNACLALMEPTACGVGGDLFAIVYDPRERRLVGLNGSGRSPAVLSAEAVEAAPDGTIPMHSPATWTVPGCVDGWTALHARFGRLPLSELLAPAIEYATRGFPVSPVVAREWARGAELFRDSPGFASVFMPGGRAPRAGEVFANAALAATLKEIALRGRAGFYEGRVAEELERFSRAHGGWLRASDLAEHASEWQQPLSVSYRERVRLWELPPPGQGVSALQLANMLECVDPHALGGREGAPLWHFLIEAKKIVYADRARLFGDATFAAAAAPSLSPPPLARLLSKEYARERVALIDPARAATVEPPPWPWPSADDGTRGGGEKAAAAEAALARRETTYLCAADEAGQMVSWIQSNYTGFGSGFAVPALGFGLQNRGALFALAADGHPNALRPRKRPFHTIIPAFLTRHDDDAPLAAFGVMGGDMQPQGHVQILANVVDFGLDAQAAGDAPRFHHTGSSEPTGAPMAAGGGVLHLEAAVPAAVRAGLAARGHRIEAPATAGVFGGYQAVFRDPESGVLCGATESRKDGCALGF